MPFAVITVSELRIINLIVALFLRPYSSPVLRSDNIDI
jgi:hypothetical protein